MSQLLLYTKFIYIWFNPDDKKYNTTGPGSATVMVLGSNYHNLQQTASTMNSTLGEKVFMWYTMIQVPTLFMRAQRINLPRKGSMNQCHRRTQIDWYCIRSICNSSYHSLPDFDQEWASAPTSRTLLVKEAIAHFQHCFNQALCTLEACGGTCKFWQASSKVLLQPPTHPLHVQHRCLHR